MYMDVGVVHDHVEILTKLTRNIVPTLLQCSDNITNVGRQRSRPWWTWSIFSHWINLFVDHDGLDILVRLWRETQRCQPGRIFVIYVVHIHSTPNCSNHYCVQCCQWYCALIIKCPCSHSIIISYRPICIIPSNMKLCTSIMKSWVERSPRPRESARRPTHFSIFSVFDNNWYYYHILGCSALITLI